MQGQVPQRVFIWKPDARPQASGDFWIVVQSDDLDGDQVAWSAARNAPTAHSDSAHDGFKLNRDLQTDFNFRVFVEPP